MKQFRINTKLLESYSPIIHELAECVNDAMNNGEYEDLNEAIWDAINSKLIFEDDQWDVLKDFCRPQEADYNTAIDGLHTLLWWTIKDKY